VAIGRVGPACVRPFFVRTSVEHRVEQDEKGAGSFDEANTSQSGLSLSILAKIEWLSSELFLLLKAVNLFSQSC
jgi:hypothetical protein